MEGVLASLQAERDEDKHPSLSREGKNLSETITVRVYHKKAICLS